MREDIKTIRKENSEQEKSLFKDNGSILTDMVVYLHSSDLCEYDIEMIRKDLIGMALEAQLRDEKFSDVIGEDYKGFCDQLMVIGDKKSSYEKALEFLFITNMGIGCMFVLEIISNYLTLNGAGKTLLTFYLPITWGFVIMTLIALVMSYGIYRFVTHYSFEWSGKHSKMISFLFCMSFVIMVCITAVTKYLLRDAMIGTINYLIPLSIMTIVFIIIKLLTNRLQAQKALGSKSY